MRPRPDRERPLVRVVRHGAPEVPRLDVRLVHPGSLPASAYDALAEALPPQAALSVADLEAVREYWEAALRGGEADTSIEALADRVAAQLEPADPADRLVLAGWSFGGVVAHAIAARHADALAPEKVVLLDTIAPVDAFAHADETIAPGRVLGWFAMYLGAKRCPLGLEPADLAPLSAEEGLARVLAAGLDRGALSPGTTLAGLSKAYRAYLAGLRRNQRLADRFDPPASPVPLALVKPEGSLLPDSDHLGWDDIESPALRVASCAGDHYSMLRDPHAVAVIVDVLASQPESGAAVAAALGESRGS